MKQLMKIIGMEIKHSSNPGGSGNGIVEVTLVPKEIVKMKPTSIMDLVGGNVEEIQQQLQQQQQFQTKIYISMHEWLKEFKNQPCSDVQLEISIDKYANEIAKK